VVGANELARRTIHVLRSARSLGYFPVRVAPLAGETSSESFEELPVLADIESAPELARRGIRVVLVVHEGGEPPHGVIHDLQRHFRHVIMIRGGQELPVEGVEIRNLGGVLAVEFRNQLLRRRNRITKRALDIVLASVGLVLALPLIAVSALLLKLSSRGPVFFKQTRDGLGGRRITVRKLRTMYTDAEERLERHLAEDSRALAEWNLRYKLHRDPRIIPVVGTLLRRTSIDELPQLWNVLIGDMSMVGPRPFPEYHLERFSPEFRDLRARVRPGLTGLWQVMVRSAGDIEDQQAFDTYYIRNWSVWMDAYILGRTAAAVITGRGAQ
jgi:exopolysaccharide biosynthesis polyprenyl glycosylphosphotransferase